MDLRTTFITWYHNEFRFDPLFEQMLETVEGSPHHMEENVGVHTDMVVSQYLSRVPDWNHTALLGALAAAFHDVGKPIAEEKRWREDRGWYNKYAGHELASARVWEDWAVRHWNRLVEDFQLYAQDLYFVGWMIENHIPYQITKQEKFDGLVQTMTEMQPCFGPDVFTTFLLADVYGRISADADDPNGKLKQVERWVSTFRTRDAFVASRMHEQDRPTVTILIGPSGAGKSTTVKRLLDNSDAQYFSLDQLRHDWYSDDYAEAFEMSCEDKEFNNKAQNEYRRMLKEHKDIIVDNTNTSRKRRRFYVQEARNRGYNVDMVIMPVTYQQLLDRQLSRDDKVVPPEAVRSQFMKMNYPSYDEAERIFVLDHNLHT